MLPSNPSLLRPFTFLVACCLFATSCLSATIKDLKPFDTISVCAPLNVLVVPSTDGASQALIEADQDQASLIRAIVSGSKLSIETTGNMQANGDIKVTVSLPATALKAVEVRSSSDVFLAPGFVSKALQLTSSQLGGSIAASQLTAEQLFISAAGLGKVTVEGVFGDVSVDAQGASSVHSAGLEKKATLSLGALSEVAITAKNAGATIMGTSEGSKVLHNQGFCFMKGASGPLCVRDKGLHVSAAPLRWTCKATLTGTNMCNTSGSSASTFASIGSDCSIMEVQGVTPATSRKRATTRRRLRETTISAQTTSSDSQPSSYTYSTTSTGSDGAPLVTSCSFVNNVGGCQVNGSQVPVQQFGVNFPVAPAPAPLVDPLVVATSDITQAASAANSISTATASSLGGTACAFVNGIGGCQTAANG